MPHTFNFFSRIQFLIIIQFLLLLPIVQGQTPCFTAQGTNGQQRGCVPFTINVTDCSSGGVNLRYKYNEEQGFVENTTYTYTKAGRYSITQVGSFGGAGDSLRKENYIEVLPTPAPNFFVRVCAGREVVLTLNDNIYEEYIINWGDGITQTVPKGTVTINHNYTTSSRRSITVTGNYVPGGCGGSNALLVTPLNAISLPEVQLLKVQTESSSQGIIRLSFITDENYNYQIQRKSSLQPTYQVLTTVIGTSQNYTFEDNGLNTQGDTYCYRIVVIDRCGNSVTSDEFCAINLEALAENNQNVLQWTQSSANNFQKYILYKNQIPITEITNKTTQKYVDTDILCEQTYCYSIVAVVGTLIQTQVQSDEECVKSFSRETPPAVNNLRSTIENNSNIIISWDNPPLPATTSYQVVRKISPLTFTGPAESTTNLTIQDKQNAVIDENLPINQANQQYCYEITYTNVCGIVSEKSVRTCPVILRIEEAVGDKITLLWSSYEGSNAVQGYVLEKLDEKNQVYFGIDLGGRLIFIDENITQDRQVLRYRIRTTLDETKQIYSYSNIQEYRQPYKIYFPNAFTPDNDGLNDIFEAKGLFIQEMQLVIFTRSGEQVFTAENLSEGWNGLWNGSPAPADVYVYVAEIKDFTGQTYTASGTFTLIR